MEAFPGVLLVAPGSPHRFPRGLKSGDSGGQSRCVNAPKCLSCQSVTSVALGTPELSCWNTGIGVCSVPWSDDELQGKPGSPAAQCSVDAGGLSAILTVITQ